MVAALVLPDFAADVPIDLRQHYYREALPFFLCLMAMLATSFFKDVLLDGHPPSGRNLAFHLVFAVSTGIAAVTRARRYHELLSVTTLALITAYITVLFSRLG